VRDTGRVITGVLLVAVGVFFLAVNQFPGLFRMEMWWPAFILVPGLSLLGAGLFGRLARNYGVASLAIPGSIVTVVGLILLFANTTNHWEVWSYAWGLIVAAVGLGIMLTSHPENTGGQRAGFWLLVAGSGAFLVFGSVFEGFLFGGTLATYWPVLLIILGGLVMLLGRG